ncbi:50S ribosomal protein L9 [Thermosulfuriphilus ammonigenes]|uniref:Large ribosomal subunit protein bL9 n=1 Tax=Thermosulfuriphilus ammonigenes TaxID=1936021 RepID=A0A6G7PX83_9BACT|nr:50S ribosomal protein L9 [Thermosulfuriphilus ammonigenes]MBA2847775.1 large subunit ribosomal protein L9 [Thermosulfuriphilus ammonigenes]QIJ72023.1 50S ribosomal protein L9 [Thermosulfuriphilus ammonigenes]HFB83451.1 50S ribosomal protein L9 [Thermodesulfatator sp.]
MEVILREAIPNLGQAGDIVKVADGYARNYLLPKGKAIIANRKNLAALEKERQIILAKAERERQKLASVAERLEGLVLTIAQRVAEENRLYGSVSAQEIVNALKEHGIEISRRQVMLREPIKHLGEFEVPIKLGGATMANIKVVVVAQE